MPLVNQQHAAVHDISAADRGRIGILQGIAGQVHHVPAFLLLLGPGQVGTALAGSLKLGQGYGILLGLLVIDLLGLLLASL